MKKAFLLLLGSFSFFTLSVFPLTLEAAESPVNPSTVHVVTEDEMRVSPGLSSFSSGQSPQIYSPVQSQGANDIQVGYVASQHETKSANPQARKKEKTELVKQEKENKKRERMEKAARKKEKRERIKAERQEKRGKFKKNREEKNKKRLSDKAMQQAIEMQVAASRAERIQQMPYLDKIYIQSQITPLKIQQKEEFLKGGPKDLQDIIARARSVNTKAKADYENIALYHRRLIQSFRKLFPDVSLNMNNREGSLSGLPGIPETYTGVDWHVVLRQPLFNGGILWNTFLQEKANLEAAKKNFDKTNTEIVYDLSRVYFEYQRTLQTVEEHKAMVEKMKRFAEMSENKFQQKIISEIEHLNVQSLYSQMQFDLESAHQELELAKLDVQKNLDLSPNDALSMAKVYDLSPLFQNVSSGPEGKMLEDAAKVLPSVFKGDEKAPELSKMIDLSYGNRAELQVEAAKLQAARLGEKIRWGEFLPKAYLTYEIGALGEADQKGPYSDITHAANPIYSNKPTPKRDWRFLIEMNWNLGGNKVGYTYERTSKAPSLTQYESQRGTQARTNGMTFGVLDGLDAFVTTKQAEVDKLNQVFELEKAEKQVLQDVKQGYYDFQKAAIQMRSTVKRLEYRKRLRDFAEHRLSKKEIELSEYLQAESDLTREKAELHKALRDYFMAKASLNHAIGIQDFYSIEIPDKQ
ncbi:MAG TPA: TolC family protein [Candidatus Omnitrophota bacterium]|nr:TolC family protein [Candidatus Omnitrophota bacterium]